MQPIKTGKEPVVFKLENSLKTTSRKPVNNLNMYTVCIIILYLSVLPVANSNIGCSIPVFGVLKIPI